MRVKGWERALLAVAERHRAQVFTWDASNCVYFPMDAVAAVTGIDPWEAERGCTSEQDFARRLVRYGFKNVGDAFAAKFAEIHPSRMGRGDLAVVEYDGTVSGVVCFGAYLLGKTEAGMIQVARSQAVRAFKVD